MAKSVTKVVKYAPRVTKSGKTKLTKVAKEKVVNTNVSKGANTGGKPWSSDAAALKSERITEGARTKRAEIAARSVDVANVTNAAAQMTKSLAGIGQSSTAQNQSVEQAVNGGLQPAEKTRDDDEPTGEFDSPFIA